MAGGRNKVVAAVVLGVVAVATLPVAIAAADSSSSYTLLQAGFAVPLALLLGMITIALAGSVRAQNRAAIDQSTTPRGAGGARLLGILAVCLACSGGVALAVYALLTYLE